MTMSPVAQEVARWIDDIADDAKRARVFWIVHYMVHNDEYPPEPKRKRAPLDAQRIFDFLSEKYVQRSDARQRALGLQYMDAETHDLAEELARWLTAMEVE